MTCNCRTCVEIRELLPYILDDPSTPLPGNVADFVKARCTEVPGVKTPLRDLRRSYIQWCLDNKLPTSRPRDFGRQLDALGFPSVKGSRNVTCRLGIRI